jgi:lipopolysaccharide biosynthesis glycosyltransferase
MPQDPANRPGTPFSFQRFMVPEIAGYSGKAIYVDSDQIVLKDIGKLFHKDMKGSGVLCAKTGFWRKTKQALLPSSVMVLDCEKLDWDIKQIIHKLNTGELQYKELFSLTGYPHKLSSRWNSADRYYKGYTALLHYTAKSKQPWINHTHRLGYLWFTYLFEALEAGYISSEEIHQAVNQRFVRPSMSYQIHHHIRDPRQLPPEIKEHDQEFLHACAEYRFNSVPGEYRSQPNPPS